MAKKEVKEQVAETPEVKAPEAPIISFEDFLQSNPVNPGLAASFKYEARLIENGFRQRTVAEWIQALEEQSKRTY
jgi:hypothetical protein